MKIMVVEDDPAQLKYLSEYIHSQGHEVYRASDGEKAIEIIKENQNIDLVITDYKMKRVNGLLVLQKVKKINDKIDVIMITAYGNTEDAVFAMKKGAYDYLTKPLNFDEINLIIEKIETKKNLEDRVESYKNTVEDSELIYKSELMQDVIEKAKISAKNNITTLIHGESGTGKEILAEYIHKISNRAEYPLVKAFCAAIPENLIESELFGYKKGAFTGAKQEYKGKFEYANNGIILLDEITEIPQNVQVKLLRVLENKEISRVGEHRTRQLNLKIISTTNREIEKEVKSGNFREDLFYRINVFSIEIPPLRKRPKDINVLTNYYKAKYNKKYNCEIEFSDKEMNILKNYSWPGNIRELKNLIQNIIIRKDKTLLNNLSKPNIIYENINSLKLEDVERAHIIKVLKIAENNKSKAAEMLGIHRNTLRRKIEEYSIDS